jgi:glycerophosphoryl diester phosphodiesterase
MKTYYFFMILLGLLLGACSRQDEPELPPETRDYAFPSGTDMTIHSARSVFPYSFHWNSVDGVNEYTLRFSTDSAFPADRTSSYTVTTGNEYTFDTADDFEALLAGFDLPRFVSGTIYWIVIPATSRQDIHPEIHSFTGVIGKTLSGEQQAALAGFPRNVVIAHRGNTAGMPEETEAAYRWARNMGADYLECDLQQTADGVIVLLHDDDLIRTTNVKTVFADNPARTNVARLTFKQIQQLDAGSWKGARFAGEQVPSLEDLIRVCEGYRYLRKRDLPSVYPGISAAGGRQRVMMGVDNVSESTLQAAGYNQYLLAVNHTGTVYIPDEKAGNGHHPGVFAEIKNSGSIINRDSLVSLLTATGWYDDDPGRMKQVPVINDGRHVAIANTDARVVIQSFNVNYLRECKNKFRRLRPMACLVWDDRNATEYYARLAEWMDAGVTLVSPMIGKVDGANFNAAKGRMIRNAGLHIVPFTFSGNESVYNGYAGKNADACNYLDGVITDNLNVAYRFYQQLETKFLFPNTALGWPDNLQANKLRSWGIRLKD